MISFAQAQDNLYQLCRTWLVTHPDVSEPLALSESLGRYLTEDVIAALELPRSDVSAMDGYAVCTRARDGAGTSQVFVLKGESRAGEPYNGVPLTPGECVRIFTGAVVPASAGTVVIQENVERENASARILHDTAYGANIRRRGEEIAADAVIATAGQLITPNMIPLLASQGIAEVKVRTKLRVAFFATGDELKAAGDNLGEGDIYESNLASIAAVLGHYPIDLINLGVVEDTPEAIKACLAEASNNADVVISSGGVELTPQLPHMALTPRLPNMAGGRAGPASRHKALRSFQGRALLHLRHVACACLPCIHHVARTCLPCMHLTPRGMCVPPAMPAPYATWHVRACHAHTLHTAPV